MGGTVPTYCKAYLLGDLRRFDSWSSVADARQASLADDTVCYIHEDLSVTETCFARDANLVPHVTAEWESFCRGELQFEVPEDIRAAQAAVAALAAEHDAPMAAP
jgi:hypothetical protein